MQDTTALGATQGVTLDQTTAPVTTNAAATLDPAGDDVKKMHVSERIFDAHQGLSGRHGIGTAGARLLSSTSDGPAAIPFPQPLFQVPQQTTGDASKLFLLRILLYFDVHIKLFGVHITDVQHLPASLMCF